MFVLSQKLSTQVYEKLKERSFNTYKFSNQDNKFILFFQKGVYPYE